MNQENIDKKTDEEIVKLTLEDQEFFLHIVKRYKNKLFAYIRRISNIKEEEIEDVLQNVFIKVYLNLNDFDSDLKFSSWIYRIAHNEVIDNYRKTKARPQISDLDMDDDRIKSFANDFDIEKELDNKILKDKLLSIINELDFNFKEILILKFLEEKSYKEISDIIKKPMGTVASRVNKAKKELKIKISKVLVEIN